MALPYITAPGNITKALNEIKKASVPDKVSQDFVKTMLKIRGGSGNQMTSFLKKMGMANSDGSVTERYRKFRNPSTSRSEIAEAIRQMYAPLYLRNEYMHTLEGEELKNLIMEETGAADDASTLRLIASSIEHLKSFADFDAETIEETAKLADTGNRNPASATTIPIPMPPLHEKGANVGINLGYTINLNLPATADPRVFDAIFKSLKDNLLRNEDA